MKTKTFYDPKWEMLLDIILPLYQGFSKIHKEAGSLKNNKVDEERESYSRSEPIANGFLTERVILRKNQKRM